MRLTRPTSLLVLALTAQLCNSVYAQVACAPGSAACTACPANSQSAQGSGPPTACRCDAGFSGPDGWPCTVSAMGSFKSTTGSAACAGCPAGYTGSRVCLQRVRNVQLIPSGVLQMTAFWVDSDSDTASLQLPRGGVEYNVFIFTTY